MVTAGMSVVCAPAFFFRWKPVGVIVASLSAFPLLAASVLVALSGSWAVLPGLTAPPPLVFLPLLFDFRGSVGIHVRTSALSVSVFIL